MNLTHDQEMKHTSKFKCCECGCKRIVPIAKLHHKRDGIVKGRYYKFISGHQNRRFIKNHTDEPQEGQFKHKGYIYILSPKHPFPTQGRYVKRARLVMESQLGRYLVKGEIVHHINEIRDDDRVENLKLLGFHEHMRLHKQLKKDKLLEKDERLGELEEVVEGEGDANK